MNVIKVFARLELWVNVTVAIFFPRKDYNNNVLVSVFSVFMLQ